MTVYRITGNMRQALRYISYSNPTKMKMSLSPRVSSMLIDRVYSCSSLISNKPSSTFKSPTFFTQQYCSIYIMDGKVGDGTQSPQPLPPPRSRRNATTPAEPNGFSFPMSPSFLQAAPSQSPSSYQKWGQIGRTDFWGSDGLTWHWVWVQEREQWVRAWVWKWDKRTRSWVENEKVRDVDISAATPLVSPQ